MTFSEDADAAVGAGVAAPPVVGFFGGHAIRNGAASRAARASFRMARSLPRTPFSGQLGYFLAAAFFAGFAAFFFFAPPSACALAMAFSIQGRSAFALLHSFFGTTAQP